MLEFLFEILGEFLLQVLGEMLIEVGLQSLAEPFRKSPNPWLAALGYTVLGAVAGAVSLWLFPNYLVPMKSWRVYNAALTPIATGLCMAVLGAWRAKRGQPVLRIDRFWYGYLFALALGLVRFGLAA